MTQPTMLGAPFQPAPGLLVVSPSRLRDFLGCRQRFHLTHVLGLRTAPDLGELGDTSAGLHVHAELHARHEAPDSHDDHEWVHTDTPEDPVVRRAVRAHLQLCPGTAATYLGGELDLRWYVPSKAVLVTGRVDALWSYPDGTIEVRDYKTGSVPDRLDDDPGALLYAALAAAHHPAATHLRVVYERLGGEHPGTVTLEVDGAVLRQAHRSVLDLAEQMRRERTFPASPHPSRCRTCAFAEACPDSVAE